jgi:AcrR family transcriptional regulator
MKVPMHPEEPAQPRRRPDAERNRAKILSVARDAFADDEAEISMAEVARRAGVGMATLYRNFPGRRELLEALYSADVTAICQAAATVPGRSPGERFQGWLHPLFAFFAGKRHIASELLKHTDEDDPVFGGNRDRVLAAGRPLLDAAQRTGEIRADLTLGQILDLVHAIASIPGESDYVEPILALALNGLRLPGVVEFSSPATTTGDCPTFPAADEQQV